MCISFGCLSLAVTKSTPAMASSFLSGTLQSSLIKHIVSWQVSHSDNTALLELMDFKGRSIMSPSSQLRVLHFMTSAFGNEQTLGEFRKSQRKDVGKISSNFIAHGLLVS
jgi:hypothetical protein